MATLVLRWPRGESVAIGRSRCDRCGQTIAARDLVPLVSSLLLRGKCRQCGVAIDPAHRVIEGLCVLAGGAAMMIAPGQAGFLGALFGWLLIGLAALDLKHFWLPDRLTGAIALVGLAGALTEVPPPLVERLIGGAAGFLVLAAIALAYRIVRKRDGMGGGDPKLLGAIGLVLGWQSLSFVVLGACIVGLLWIGAQLAARREINATDRLPLGALMCLSAFSTWMAMQA